MGKETAVHYTNKRVGQLVDRLPVIKCPACGKKGGMEVSLGLFVTVVHERRRVNMGWCYEVQTPEKCDVDLVAVVQLVGQADLTRGLLEAQRRLDLASRGANEFGRELPPEQRETERQKHAPFIRLITAELVRRGATEADVTDLRAEPKRRKAAELRRIAERLEAAADEITRGTDLEPWRA